MTQDNSIIELKTAISRRLGTRGNADELVTAYLNGIKAFAIERTIASGPVPTSLATERAALLFQVCKELKRLIDDHEIQALLRLSPSLAAALRRTLLATYPDHTDELIVNWSVQDAKSLGRETIDNQNGIRIKFTDRDRRDRYSDIKKREGTWIETKTSELDHPWLVVVSEQCKTAKLLEEKRSPKKPKRK